MTCHNFDTGTYPAINISFFGVHSDINITYGRIDISKISPGKHFIYLEAMERNDKWGTPVSLEINLEGED